MSQRIARYARLSAVGGVLFQVAGCIPALNDRVGEFFGDFALEAWAALMF